METSNPTATLKLESNLQKNDNSNPQQGSEVKSTTNQSGRPTHTEMKVADTEGPLQEGNGAQSGAAGSPEKKECRKLFVGGLPQDVTEAEFHDFFAQFGEITDSVVMFDRETHRSRGFGFVTYEDADVARRLLKMGHDESSGEEDPRVGRLVMRGKTCEVKAAEPKEASRFSRKGYPVTRKSSPGKHAMPNGLYHPATAFSGPQYYAGPHNPHHAVPPSPSNAYPVYAPGYYPAYHPAMYGGSAYYPAPTPVYAPVTDAAVPVPVPALLPVESPQVPVAPVSAPVEGVAGPVNLDQNGAYPVPYAPHVYMAHPAYLPGTDGVAPMNHVTPPGAPPSAMQPAAPGLPNKDE